MTILNCNNEDEDDDNGDDWEEGNSDDMLFYRLFQIHRPLAGHFVTMVVRLGRVKLPCVVAIYSPPPSSSKHNQHLTIPFCLPSTASRDPSTKSRFGPRVGFKMAAFVQHLKSTYVGCVYWDFWWKLCYMLKQDPIWQHWKPLTTFSQLSSTHVIWALPTPLKPSWQLNTAFWLPDVLMMINIILLTWCPRQWRLIARL